MAQPTQPKRPYQPPSVTSVKVFLPMLAATTGNPGHHFKQRVPPSPH